MNLSQRLTLTETKKEILMNKQESLNKSTKQIREVFKQSLNLHEGLAKSIKLGLEAAFWEDECISPTDDIPVGVFYEYILLVNTLLTNRQEGNKFFERMEKRAENNRKKFMLDEDSTSMISLIVQEAKDCSENAKLVEQFYDIILDILEEDLPGFIIKISDNT